MRRGLAAPAAWALGRILALLLAVVSLSPSAATAQECEPGSAWPTTEFEVLLTKPFIPSDWLAVVNQLAAVEEWLRSSMEELVRSDEVNAGIAAADAEWKRRVGRHLSDIARRYEAAGFGCPEMETVRVDGELRYVAYLVDFSEELIETLRDEGALGYAYPVGRHGPAELLMRYLRAQHWVVIDRERFRAPRSEHGEEHLYWTLAHELFHMIQGTYDVRYGSIRMFHDASDVVLEGGADGAAMYLVSQRFPEHLPMREDSLGWLGAFPYHKPLVDASRDKKITFGDPYQTMSFWFHLAERYGSLAVIEGLLRHRLEAVSRTGRLMWLEAGLRSGRGFGKGLVELFPHFLTEFASYGESRYGGVSSDKWLVTVLGGCREPSAASYTGKPQEPVEFTLEDQEDARRPYWIGPLAGRCAAAKWTAETEDPPLVALQVEITGTDRKVLGDLHVGLARSTIRDATCWEQSAGMGTARSPCMLEPVGDPFEVDGTWHRIWEVEPGDYAAEGEAMVVIARVAEQPWEMEWEGAQIEVRFQLLHEKASMAEGGGGPSGADVAAPLEIELNQVLLDVVRPYLNNACLVRFRLKNAETREGIEIQMDHSGPIGEGTYAISAGDDYHAPPEDYPNTFIGGFAVVMGEERPYEFWFDSGQVEIESITGRQIRGEIRANGVRRPGYGREGEPTGASVVARFTLTANLHYPGDAREKATGAMALRCLE